MALMLAGLRGVDAELWKAARVDGIPAWRVYVSIVLPLLRPMIVTAIVLLSISVIKVYDLVVALTNGGPGTASEMPAKFVMDNLFERQNIGLATAASTVMLVTVVCRARALALRAPISADARRAGMSRFARDTCRHTCHRPARAAPARPHGRAASASMPSSLVAAAVLPAPRVIMVLTSLKTMDEIRQGQIFALPEARPSAPGAPPGRAPARG